VSALIDDPDEEVACAAVRALVWLTPRRGGCGPDPYEAAPPSPAPATPFEHVTMRRTAERVRAVLTELPGAQRQVLEMAYYRGLSQRDIAADLDTPLGTVKSRSRRALMMLGRALEDLTG
jgi:RNA polymerase sigma factor (sigma-70 family)